MRQPVLASLNTRKINDITPVSLPLPPKEKEKKNLYWNQENLGCPDEPISICPHMKSEGSPERWAVGARRAWLTDTLQKASLISEQKQTRSRLNSSLILRHEAQSLASVLRSPSGEKPIALPSQEGGAPRIIYALTGRNGLWAWVSVCTSNVLFGPGYVVKLAW